MADTISFEQLQQMGAKPLNASVPPAASSAAPDGTVSFEQLQAMGAKPLSEIQAANSSDAKSDSNPVKDIGLGLLKGAGSTIKELGTFGQGIANQTAGRFANLLSGKGFTATPGPLFPSDTTRSQGDLYSPDTPAAQSADAKLKTQNGFQDLGYGAEKIAELATPTGLEGAAAKLAAKATPSLTGFAAKAVPYLAKSAAGAVDQGTKSILGGDNAAQSGTIAGFGAVSPFAEGIAQKLPIRLVRGALPKLTPGNEGRVLNNTNLGSISSMLTDSKAAVDGYDKQIRDILASPTYKTNTGAGNFAVQATVHAFPNSEYTPELVTDVAKKLAPDQSKLIDKIADGTATLEDKNAVRSGLDSATKKRFTDAPDLTANKDIGAKFADNLRAEVQAHAPETQPIFTDFSKELDLQKALAARNKQLQNRSSVGLLDLLSFFAAGLPALVGERAATSPAISVATAKGINQLNKVPAKLPGLTRAITGQSTASTVLPSQ